MVNEATRLLQSIEDSTKNAMSGGCCSQTWEKTVNLTVPKPERGVAILCGILNFFFFGIGTIIAGVLENDLPDVAIGILQLCIPFVGWIWSILWGVLMILDK